ncbi:uncharacterized protein YndB with AHSA1/START domain [Kibdelosporangium banguiense]|uniref:Uncharacterized protein YndB with AHSA1/START domain n=1 Tax=Kibdelosporangium banguiense TaxID=1365924 RepID=A0ABS4T6G3_9PSEU|nr:SRPBCC domain-containing protein [Kibdelosporangium banguiense]MBP2320020.1 uncharacterized protein YndB with AHSA1/START domain [Kibdelosporangium banguiense]
MTEPMQLRAARIAATADTVWNALTDPQALHVWFAEHVDVHLPEQYQFWGRYTIEGTEPRQRLLHADDHLLRFEWLDTTVEIEVTEQAGTASVTVRQTNLPSMADMLAQDHPLALMHTFWALAVANLVDYAEGREIACRVDYTATDLRQELVIEDSPQAVFHSLTDEDALARWFGAKIQMDHHAGGRWAMGGFEADSAPAEIITLEPGRELAIKWPDGIVNTWELAGSQGKTRLTFVQSGFMANGERGYGSWAGWLAGFVELCRMHEVTGWRPMWTQVHVDGLDHDLLRIEKQEA